MYRTVPLCALLCLATLAFAQTPSDDTASSTTPVQLVYVIDGLTLTTYNINSQTFQPSLAGTTTLRQSVYPNLITSPNGHIIYFTAYQNTNQQGQRLYVYSTNSSGVPGNQPIQTIGAQSVYSPFVDPTDKFLYVVRQGTIGEYTNYSILRYVIDPNTGKISLPVTVGKYRLSTNALYCYLSIFGMNAAGTKLYDEVSCGYPHGGSSATYYQRSVDPQTGTLGPDQQIYAWNNASGNDDNVQFVKNLMFDFVVSNYQQNANVLNVYSLQPNVKNPIIQCTESMLADCGSDYNMRVHPSAQYVFMVTPSYTTNIDKVELSSKQIVGTSSTIPYLIDQFSPDGKIVYAANDVNTALNIQIYGFNVSTAQVTTGGLISVPSNLDSWFVAERH